MLLTLSITHEGGFDLACRHSRQYRIRCEKSHSGCSTRSEELCAASRQPQLSTGASNQLSPCLSRLHRISASSSSARLLRSRKRRTLGCNLKRTAIRRKSSHCMRHGLVIPGMFLLVTPRRPCGDQEPDSPCPGYGNCSISSWTGTETGNRLSMVVTL